jgi:hypothetical protein
VQGKPVLQVQWPRLAPRGIRSVLLRDVRRCSRILASRDFTARNWLKVGGQCSNGNATWDPASGTDEMSFVGRVLDLQNEIAEQEYYGAS